MADIKYLKDINTNLKSGSQFKKEKRRFDEMQAML